MPVTISKDESGRYFVATFVGAISDDELLSAYSTFYQSDEWEPGLHELADFSRGTLERLSWAGLVSLASWERTFLKQRGVEKKKTALYLPRGQSSMQTVIYDVWTSGSPELFEVFHDRDAAIYWLMEND